jgi:hypothetical protein
MNMALLVRRVVKMADTPWQWLSFLGSLLAGLSFVDPGIVAFNPRFGPSMISSFEWSSFTCSFLPCIQ